MDTTKLTDTLKIVANVHRANIMRCLHLRGRLGFSEMMEQLGLDTKADCGTFGYHLSELQRSGVLQRDRKGFYSLTELGERVWSAMEQIDQKIGQNIRSQGEESVSITRFREEDIPDVVRWTHEEQGDDAPVELVEAVMRHNHFVDGPFGDFLGEELRMHSYIARSVPGGEILGWIGGYTYFDPYGGGYPLYGEERLTLFVREPALASGCDKELVFSLLFKKMTSIADKNRYNLWYESWIQVNEKEHELKTFKDLGLHPHVWPKSRRVCYRTPDWMTEHTLRRLKAEGFNPDLIDLVGTTGAFSKQKAQTSTKMESQHLEEQIQKLLERGIISEHEEGWVLAEKYQTPYLEAH